LVTEQLQGGDSARLLKRRNGLGKSRAWIALQGLGKGRQEGGNRIKATEGVRGKGQSIEREAKKKLKAQKKCRYPPLTSHDRVRKEGRLKSHPNLGRSIIRGKAVDEKRKQSLA